MDLDPLIAYIEPVLDRFAFVQARIKLDFGADGLLLIDATVTPPTLAFEDQEADFTILATLEDFLRTLNGELEPALAYLGGKLRLKGSLAIGMRVGEILP